MKSLVIIPTYNERTNIDALIKEVLEQDGSIDILIIDDNSPDGTGELADTISKTNSKVKVIHREKKLGLGSAYVVGFKHAIQSGYDYIFEMDADFSHNPNRLPVFLDSVKDYDLIIGSRYLNGISVVNWPLRRLALSLMASYYVRIILGMPVKDCTSGFKCFTRKVLESIDLNRVKSDGYSFQIEMNYRAFKKGFKLGEIPIIFIDRHSGQSKMSRKIVWEALFVVWRLKIEYLFKRKG